MINTLVSSPFTQPILTLPPLLLTLLHCPSFPPLLLLSRPLPLLLFDLPVLLCPALQQGVHSGRKRP